MNQTYSPEGKPKAADSVQAKPTRADEVKQERRRRQDTGPLDGLNLHVPEDEKDPNYDYRWFNDVGNRLENKTKRDDWEIVRTESTLVDKTPRSGAPMKAYLCRKRKEYQAEDQGKRMARLKEQEDSILRGAVKSPEGLSAEEMRKSPTYGGGTLEYRSSHSRG